MKLAQDADNQFYEEVWPHAADVLRTAHFLSPDFGDAEDLAQETMLKAFRFLDRFKPGTNIKAWLMTILRNTRIDRVRADASWRSKISLADLCVDPESPAAESSHSDFDEITANPDALLDSFSDEQMIHTLQKLPEEVRWVLLLIDVQEITQAEAAKILTVPLGTIKSRLYRGRAMLRQRLRPCSGDAVYSEDAIVRPMDLICS